jgi:hypothetical protein
MFHRLKEPIYGGFLKLIFAKEFMSVAVSATLVQREMKEVEIKRRFRKRFFYVCVSHEFRG